MESYVK